MRIKNRYQRNRLAKTKARNRVKKFVGGEFSLKCFCPWSYYGLRSEDAKEQIKDHSKWIDTFWVRYLINGGKGMHAPRWYKNSIERSERRAVQQAITRMMKSVDDVDDIDVPTFIHQADWDWF